MADKVYCFSSKAMFEPATNSVSLPTNKVYFSLVFFLNKSKTISSANLRNLRQVGQQMPEFQNTVQTRSNNHRQEVVLQNLRKGEQPSLLHNATASVLYCISYMTGDCWQVSKKLRKSQKCHKSYACIILKYYITNYVAS